MQAGFPLKYAMLAWLCLLWPRLAGSKCREPSGNLWQWVESHAASTGARCAVPASLDVLWRHACTHSAFQYEFRTPDWFWYWIRLNNLNLSLFVCHLSPFAGSAVCWPASLEVCWHSKSKWHVYRASVTTDHHIVTIVLWAVWVAICFLITWHESYWGSIRVSQVKWSYDEPCLQHISCIIGIGIGIGSFSEVGEA